MDRETHSVTDSIISIVEYVTLEGASSVSEHISLLDVGTDIRTADMLLFNDLLINGREVKLNFDMDLHAWDYQDSVALDFDLFQITKSYYQYAESFVKYLGSRGNPFAKPVQVYNNVKNGLGLLAGIAVTGSRVVIRK